MIIHVGTCIYHQRVDSAKMRTARERLAGPCERMYIPICMYVCIYI